MNGDITRSTFDSTKGYSSVRLQQGRVQLDADLNEQRDIELHDERAFRQDDLGQSGAPIGDDGMEITETVTGLHVGAGTFYVDGIRIRSGGANVEDLPTAPGLYLVYLDAWERLITAVEDPEIREVALGGPDTATRSRVEWRVRLLPVTTLDPDPDCTTTFAEWDTLLAGSTGTLEVQFETTAASINPCKVPEDAGYRGLDNRLYRVQIHDGNFDPSAPGGVGAGAPTFKWSHDNAAILGAWVAPPAGVDVEVDRLGPGGADGFVRGGWVELGNDGHDLAEAPGVLAEVDDILGTTLRLLDPGGLPAALSAAYDATLHPKVRRWDSAGAVSLAAGTWLDLEDGLQVRFNSSSSWRPGDYWTVAARTAVLPGTTDRQIDWPVDGAGNPLPLVAQGPSHHRARLALATFDGTTWIVSEDCRQLFPPLTHVVDFSARGGEGQHAPSEHWLPAPLVAGVSRGKHAVVGAQVRFRRAGSTGTLSAAAPDATGGGATEVAAVVVPTGADGLARVWWRLGQGPVPEPPADTYQPEAAQHVIAELLDPGANPDHVPIDFAAIPLDPLVLVDAGGNGQLGLPGETLEIALRARVSAGSLPAEGAHVAFEIQSRMFQGTPLDQFSGGSLHASTNVVSTTAWPGGTRTVRAVVATDAAGVAQLQWVLGTESRLTEQRVTATLLDRGGNPTTQEVLFTAHLALASEIGWQPCPTLQELLPGGQGSYSVQNALDVLCDLFGFVRSARVLTAPGPVPMVPEAVVRLAVLQGIELRLGRSPQPAPSDIAARAALLIQGGVPLSRRGYLLAEIPGSFQFIRGPDPAVRWSISADARAWVDTLLRTDPVMLVRVTLRPGLVDPRVPPSVEWGGAFQIGR